MAQRVRSSPVVTRFAPSPTGYLHLGHAFSALFAARAAEVSAGGRFLLRIEDLDQGRARAEFEAAIFEDLRWLGLTWEEPVMRQSQRAAAYAAACDRLTARGLTYPCFCTRKDIAAQIANASHAPHGPDGALYPGICRGLPVEERVARMDAGEPFALRLDIAAARREIGRRALTFRESGAGPDGETGRITVEADLFGDIVLARKDAPASYHLAVVVDDAAQGVTLVTRGADLFHAAHVQRVLQVLLDLPEPEYRHHALLRDETGRRLAKRDNARAVRALRQEGLSPDDVLMKITA